MRITIITIGSRGDVQPYIALGLGLLAAGHQVRLATSASFESFVRDYGLDFAAVSGDIQALMAQDKTRSMVEQKTSPLHALATLTRKTRQELEQMMVSCWSACRGSNAVMGSLVGALAGQPIAQKLGIPYLSAYLQPTHRTGAFPSSFSLFPRSPDWLGVGRGEWNRLSHVLTSQVFWTLFRPTLNQARQAALDMPRLSGDQPYPVLYGYSPAVLPKPADWDTSLHVTGYWFLDRPTGWRPPGDLVDFLEAGPPPIYVGFGSMVGSDPEALGELAVAALERAKLRGILAGGWGGLRRDNLPAHVIAVDSVPHDWLFSRVAAAVHHGGAGTTGAALRAGIPSMVVPFIADQFFWGERVGQLGVGPRPLLRKNLTVERLAAAMDRVVNDPKIRLRAKSLGQTIQMENGVARAVEAFHSHAAYGSTPAVQRLSGRSGLVQAGDSLGKSTTGEIRQELCSNKD